MDIANSALVNLALLETIRAKNTGYFVDHFVNFLAVALSESARDELTLDQGKELFEKQFNLAIPISSIKLILDRSCKKGLLNRHDHKYSVDGGKIEKISSAFKKRKTEVAEAQTKLFSRFIQFAKDKYNLDLDVEKSEKCFGNFFRQYQVNLIDFDDQKFSRVPNGSIKNLDFLMSSFIAEIYREKDPVFAQLEKVVRGYLVTNFLSIRSNESETDNFSGMVVILDTPLLMGLAGFNGNLRADSCAEMIRLGKTLKITFAVFEHIFEEWESIFSAWANDLRNKNFREFNTATFALLKARNMDAAAIEALIPRLKSILQKFEIKIIDLPPSKTAYTLDELGLQAHLKDKGWIDKNNRIERDLKTVAGVYSFRKGRSRMAINEKPTLFITSNTGLMTTINEFFKDEISNKSVPLICTDIWLTNLCWMTNPDLFPGLPQHLLVANCYGAMHADDKFWESFLTRFRRLKKEGKIDPEDYKLVRYELDLKNSLKEHTVKDGLDFGDETVFEVVKSTKEKILKEKDDKIGHLENRFQRINERIDSAIDWTAWIVTYLILAALTTLMALLGYEAWEHQESLPYFIGTSLVSLVLLWFDASFFNRRRIIFEKIVQRIRPSIKSLVGLVER